MKKLTMLVGILLLCLFAIPAFAATAQSTANTKAPATYADNDTSFGKASASLATAKADVKAYVESSDELGIGRSGARDKAMVEEVKAILAMLEGKDVIFEGPVLLEVQKVCGEKEISGYDSKGNQLVRTIRYVVGAGQKTALEDNTQGILVYNFADGNSKYAVGLYDRQTETLSARWDPLTYPTDKLASKLVHDYNMSQSDANFLVSKAPCKVK